MSWKRATPGKVSWRKLYDGGEDPDRPGQWSTTLPEGRVRVLTSLVLGADAYSPGGSANPEDIAPVNVEMWRWREQGGQRAWERWCEGGEDEA